LDDAGYLDSYGDGIRETADGLPLEFRLFYQLEEPPQLTAAELISDWLRGIGIEAEVEAIEFGTATSVVLGERDFDMMIYNMYTDFDGPAHMDYTISCWAAGAGPVGRNYPGYCNEEFDALMYEAFYTMDEEQFKESLFAAEEILNQERPFITLAGINTVQAYNGAKFEFPERVCHESDGGLLSWYPLMNVIVK